MVTFLRLRSVTIFQPRFLLGAFLRYIVHFSRSILRSAFTIALFLIYQCTFKIWVAFLRGRGNFLKIKIKTFIFMVSLLSTALLLFASFIWALFSIKGLLQNINHPHFLIKNQDQYQDFARAFYFLSITFSFSLKHFRRAHF